MMLSAATPYDSLPGMPTVNALGPGGVPYGPWHRLYRAAPGAQLPAVHLPGLTRHPMQGMMGGLGAYPNVSFVGGLGQEEDKASKRDMVLGALLAAVLSAGIAAGFAWTRETKHNILNPALFMGGVTLAGGLLTVLAANNEK